MDVWIWLRQNPRTTGDLVGLQRETGQNDLGKKKNVKDMKRISYCASADSCRLFLDSSIMFIVRKRLRQKLGNTEVGN